MSNELVHAEPVAYLVAERRSGQWLLGDEWAHRYDTLDEAREELEQWRSLGYVDAAVLAVTVVS